MKKKVVFTLWQEVKVKDDIKIYYTGKFQHFTARYIVNCHNCVVVYMYVVVM